ncbi:MAG: hypothetical protein GTO18_21135 [Anaerolineales bacterium]|nr:hypothetical protein [Anaerolineales bacterium]
MAIVVLLAIWVVVGILMAVLAGTIWKGDRPYGDAADYIVSIVLAIITGLIDWYLVADWLNIEGALKFGISIIEPAAVSLIGLWVMRLVKSRSTS